MQMKKILFPTDFSEATVQAWEQANAMAKESGAKLLVVHVDEPASAYGGGGDVFYVTTPANRKTMLRRLEAIVPTDRSIPYEHHLLTGDPATEIAHFAEQQAVDMIVIGTHGRTGLRRLLLGSVAEEVVRRASCPVMTFKQHARVPHVQHAATLNQLWTSLLLF
jgi:nucleotide-binding universal stress UspA family protein